MIGSQSDKKQEKQPKIDANGLLISPHKSPQKSALTTPTTTSDLLNRISLVYKDNLTLIGLYIALERTGKCHIPMEIFLFIKLQKKER